MKRYPTFHLNLVKVHWWNVCNQVNKIESKKIKFDVVVIGYSNFTLF